MSGDALLEVVTNTIDLHIKRNPNEAENFGRAIVDYMLSTYHIDLHASCKAQQKLADERIETLSTQLEPWKKFRHDSLESPSLLVSMVTAFNADLFAMDDNDQIRLWQKIQNFDKEMYTVCGWGTVGTFNSSLTCPTDLEQKNISALAELSSYILSHKWILEDYRMPLSGVVISKDLKGFLGGSLLPLKPADLEYDESLIRLLLAAMDSYARSSRDERCEISTAILKLGAKSKVDRNIIGDIAERSSRPECLMGCINGDQYYGYWHIDFRRKLVYCDLPKLVDEKFPEIFTVLLCKILGEEFEALEWRFRATTLWFNVTPAQSAICAIHSLWSAFVSGGDLRPCDDGFLGYKEVTSDTIESLRTTHMNSLIEVVRLRVDQVKMLADGTFLNGGQGGLVSLGRQIDQSKI